MQKSFCALNLLQRFLFGSTKNVKSLAYRSLVRPCVEYASVVWNPHTVSDINIIEAVQKRAAWWICAKWNSTNFSWNKSHDVCLQELKWPTLACRRYYFIIDYIHSMFHKRNLMIIQLNSSATRSYALCIQPITLTINLFCYSFLSTLYFCGIVYPLMFCLL